MNARRWTAPSPRAELALVLALVWATLLAIPLGLGEIGLGWDALNHQIYLGWVADRPRFDRDFLGASYQAYQHPYLYWPAYKLFAANVSGAVAGAVLVSLHALAIPALWLLAKSCIVDDGWYGATMRLVAVALGVSGQLFLSLLDTTGNDALGAVPFVWGVALAVAAIGSAGVPSWPAARLVSLSGLLVGAAVGFKLSNGPLAVLMPLLWIFCGSGPRQRMVNAVRGGLWTIAGFLLVYGYWGWELWRQFGNPIFPFADNLAAPLRQVLGWHP